jgi:hypothetical protein
VPRLDVPRCASHGGCASRGCASLDVPRVDVPRVDVPRVDGCASPGCASAGVRMGDVLALMMQLSEKLLGPLVSIRGVPLEFAQLCHPLPRAEIPGPEGQALVGRLEGASRLVVVQRDSYIFNTGEAMVLP